ncbi:MAG TPA: dynamin family protein [Rhodothermales bacterium]|nr:dynamin family protein [Rhodothermales bacterium]
METLVDPQVDTLLTDEREVLTRLRQVLERTEAAPETVAQLGDVIAHLDELFLVVVVGEFNAGKSSVLNALFGEKIMEEGPIPTTAKITVLRYGEERMERQLSEYLVERRYPADLLKHLNLVDTPGTNSIIQQHQQITEDYIPRSDLVLFITSFDRPLTESERQFLTFIRGAWGKRLVFILNKADLAKSEEQLNQVLEHIRSGCQELMGFEPRIFPVSADLAYTAKTADKKAVREALWPQSRFAALEDFIVNTLGGPERLALKLTAPLDAGSRLSDALATRLSARQRILEKDEQNLAELNSRLNAARAELKDGYVRYITEVDNLLLQMERRGVQFLDDTIRIGKLNLLRDRDAFKEEFARQVVRDTDRQIEDRVTEAVDWLLKHALSLWNRTLNEFAERVREAGQGRRIPAQGEFFYNRAEVFDAIMKEAGRKIEMYDLREEARRILENARDAAAMFLGTEAVAVGVGAIATVVVTATAVDVTGGFIAAGVLAVVGLIFLPRQKRKAIAEFKERVDELRAEMTNALTVQLDQEVNTSLAKVSETVEPYAAFVKEERATLTDVTAEREAIDTEIARLRKAVGKQFGASDIGS